MLTEWDSVQTRISCRAYDSRDVEPDIVQELEAKISDINSRSGLDFQLLRGDPAVKLAGAMFSGSVKLCAAIVAAGDPVSAEMAGYFGQELVLYATSLGLGTCWVGGTFDKGSVLPRLREGETLQDVIPLGYPAAKVPVKQRMIRSAIRRKDRPLEQFVESDHPFSSLPQWIRTGAEAVKLGPSAVNQQPANIVYRDGLVTMRIWRDGANSFKYNDLGIAKYQFQAGAAHAGVRGFWNFGEDGEFIVE